MNKKKTPTFSGVSSRQESVLYDHYCFDKLFGFDLSFERSKMTFALNGSIEAPSIIKASSSVDYSSKPFNASIYFDQAGPPNLYLNYSPQQIPLSFFLKHLENGPEFNINYSAYKNDFLRPNLKVKVFPFPNYLSQMIRAGLALTSDGFKSKLKITPKKINANFSIGYNNFGFGAKGALSLNTRKIGNYGVMSWFKEDITKFILLFEGNAEKPEENRFEFYFSNKTFSFSKFVVKITNYIGKNPEFMIGTETKFKKATIKARASTNGKIAYALYKKVLPRTKVTASGEIDIKDLNSHKFGFHFSFYAKSV